MTYSGIPFIFKFGQCFAVSFMTWVFIPANENANWPLTAGLNLGICCSKFSVAVLICGSVEVVGDARCSSDAPGPKPGSHGISNNLAVLSNASLLPLSASPNATQGTVTHPMESSRLLARILNFVSPVAKTSNV